MFPFFARFPGGRGIGFYASRYIATRMIDYMNWDTSTTFRKLYTPDKELDFPVVTICNFNKFFYNQKAIERKMSKEAFKMMDDLGLSDSEVSDLLINIYVALDKSWMDEVIDSDKELLTKTLVFFCLTLYFRNIYIFFNTPFIFRTVAIRAKMNTTTTKARTYKKPQTHHDTGNRPKRSTQVQSDDEFTETEENCISNSGLPRVGADSGPRVRALFRPGLIIFLKNGQNRGEGRGSIP